LAKPLILPCNSVSPTVAALPSSPTTTTLSGCIALPVSGSVSSLNKTLLNCPSLLFSVVI